MLTSEFVFFACLFAPVWLPLVTLITLFLLKQLKVQIFVLLLVAAFAIAVGGTAFLNSIQVPSGLAYLIVLIPAWFIMVIAIIMAAVKIKITTTAARTLIIIVCVIAIALWVRVEYERYAIKNEQQLAWAFIKNNAQVIQAMGNDLRIISKSTPSEGWLSGRYEFSVSATKGRYALVNVSRTSGDPVFTLACITPLDSGARDVHDPCK
jgi:hypothetical protein